jgi:phosphatidylserine decarboxylase
MYTTLLFQESPEIVIILIIFCFISVIYKFYFIFCLLLIILVILIIFYKYKPHNKRYDNNFIVSPAEGVVCYLKQIKKSIVVSIYLNLLNNHTQIYPVNGVVIKRIYDITGKFALANNINKSKYNEKKIHIIEMSNKKKIKITQIAGFFPRRIVSSEKVDTKIFAGEYLGMIKFGSRVDIEFEGDISQIKIKNGQKINIGDIIYVYC